jgi:dehydrogenase/reductase SDR family member 7B
LVHVVSPGYIRTNLSKSALTGDGRLYNKMDDATAAGADPNDVAIDILEKSAAGKADFITAATMSARVAILLKFCAPALLQKLLIKRYEKSQKAL